jgi:Fe-S-cluster containining protein
MQMISKIKAVKRIYAEADRHVSDFKGKSGLECVHGCGICCLKPGIQTTVLEFLPAAWSLCRNGKYVDILEKIGRKTDSTCLFYNPFISDGFCSVYLDRPMICRLFGFSSRTDKYGNRIMVTCNPIKNMIRNPDFNRIVTRAPEMYSCYLKLYAIDPQLSIQYFPINESVRKALDIILLNSQYRKRPA